MVAHVLRLRLALLVGALRGRGALRAAISLLAVAAAAVVAGMAILSLDDGPTAVARTVLVLGAAAILLAFLVGPVLAGSVDQLDPRRFAVFGVDERRMPWVLALAAFVSIPSFATAAVTTCAVIVAVHHGAPWPLAVLGGIGALASTVLAARVGMALNALWLPERRSRELTALFVLVVVVIAFPVAVFLASLEWRGQVPEALTAGMHAASCSPFGAAIGFIFALAAGDTTAAWIAGVVGFVTLAVLLAAWWFLVRRLLTTTDRPSATRERSGLGWFALLPSNAFGAIAARSLVYWLRDRRYLVNIVIVPIAGILTVFPLLVAGVPFEIAVLVPAPVMALFFGWLPHNDVAYDSTAFWTHVASGVRGLPDRLGRLVPVALIAIPVLAVAVPVTLALVGRWMLALPLTGLSAALFLGGLGLSSLVSVISPYAVSRPGDSPFQQPQRSARSGTFGQAAALLGTLVLSIPTIWLFVLCMDVGGDAYTWPALWTGVGTGVVVLVAGACAGAAIFNRGGQRLMEFAETA